MQLINMVGRGKLYFSLIQLMNERSIQCMMVLNSNPQHFTK